MPDLRVGGSDRERRTAVLVLLLVFLVWSNSFIAVRVLVGEDVPASERLEPVELVAVRFAPVALFCLAYFAIRPGARREARELWARAPALVVLLASLNVWGYNLAFGAGHHRVPAGTGSLLITLNPILTFLVALGLGRERFSLRRLLGLLVAFGGVYLVVTRGAGRAVTGAYLRDAALLLGAPLSWAFYTVLGKGVLTRTSPHTATYLVLGVGSLPAAVVAIASPSLHRKVALWGPPRVGAALFLGLACSVLAFWLWFVALKRLDASTAAAFVYLNPPLTLFFEWAWFGHLPSWGLLGGGSLVLGGVALCVQAPPSSRPARAG